MCFSTHKKQVFYCGVLHPVIPETICRVGSLKSAGALGFTIVPNKPVVHVYWSFDVASVAYFVYQFHDGKGIHILVVLYLATPKI